MTDRRLDRGVLVFVLCLGVLLLLLQVASTPAGRDIPASIVALAIVVGMAATAIATIRSQASGWNKPVVRVLGALFALVAVWLCCDSPPDFRSALLDGALAVVLLAASRKATARWTASDEPTR